MADKRPDRRPDDFETRRRHLASLPDEELKGRFWDIADSLIEQLVELARTHTSPSIERAVLLRMGFSSLEAKEITDRVLDHSLLGKGAGHVVLRVAAARGVPVRQAGLELISGQHWDQAVSLFQGGEGR